jgi:hypothetical protein
MATPSVFDLASAQRIAAAVRKVEIGDRSESALRFRRELPQQQRKVFRIATFSGAWAVGATKTVEFKYQTSTPNTASVTNLFFPFPALPSTTDCAIAKDGTAWFLIDVPFETATAVFVSATASQTVVGDVSIATSPTTATASIVSGIQVAATLNTSNCDISVSTTQTTGSIAFATGITSTVTKSTASITVVSSTFTATFLSLRLT